ncbi:galactosyltransferase-related protein [Ottowia thiooxydans]|uniref:galactosyltransferase-related protein n=1 Tax=Ottowia thiooxydans TaxID=219182 RepID=UPI00040F9FCD|nr:galactosyltransferase-related protein [Ottowia thiooxydans]
MEKLSLQHIDLIVPYREASDERRENLYGVLRHLVTTYRDCRIWLMEADTRPRFDWSRIADASIRHVFISHDGPFPKARLCNMGVRLSNSAIVCFHDADSIAQPSSMVSALDALINGTASDAICPYSPVLNVEGSLRDDILQTGNVDAFGALDPVALPPEVTMLYTSANGGVVLFKRSEYIRVGGYNERMEGWCGEDNELLFRATQLGVRWHSFLPPLVHLHHDSTSRNEWTQAFQDNEELQRFHALKNMPSEAVQALAAELASQFGPR